MSNFLGDPAPGAGGAVGSDVTSVSYDSPPLGGSGRYQKSTPRNTGSIIISGTTPAALRGGDGPSNPTTLAVLTPANVGSADVRLEGVIYWPDAPSGQVGFFVRSSTGLAGYCPLYVGTTLTPYKSNFGGTFGSSYADGTLAAGSVRQLAIEVNGSTQTVYVNGVSRITGTDATVTTDGLAGFTVLASGPTDTVGPQIRGWDTASIGGTPAMATPTAGAPSAGSVTINWRAVQNGTGPGSYQLQGSTDGGTSWGNVGPSTFLYTGTDSGQTGTVLYRVQATQPGPVVTNSAGVSVAFTTGTLSVSPGTVATGSSGNALTLTGTGTSWAPGTPGTPGTPTFTASAGTVTARSVASTTSAALTYTAPSTPQTVTITDPSTGATASLVVATSPPITIPVTDSRVFWSPYNWYSDGAGALQAGNTRASSTFAQSNNHGAYVKLAVTGTATLKVAVDTSATDSYPGVVAAGYPEVAYSVNGGPIVAVQLAAGVTYPVNLTGLSGATQVQIWVKSLNNNYDFWTTLASAVKITGFVVDSGGATATLSGYYAVRSKNLIAFGDSITCGFLLNGASSSTQSDATAAYVRFLGEHLGAEVGAVAFLGQGYGSAGNPLAAPTPVLPTAYQYYNGTRSRMVSGVLSPPPDYCYVNHGTNDGNGGTTFRSRVVAFLGTLRTVCGAVCAIIQQVPFNRQTLTDVTAAVSAYKAANPSDAEVYQADCGASFVQYLNGDTSGVGSVRSSDGVHPNARGQAEAAARVSASVGALLAGAGGSGGATAVFRRQPTIRRGR